MFEERPSPVVASAASARKLPRMALLALLVIFIIPGLLSRDFWSSYELTSFALVQEMLQGDAVSWLLPKLGGADYVTDGPLTIWISAIFAKIFGPIFSEASHSTPQVKPNPPQIDVKAQSWLRKRDHFFPEAARRLLS